MPMELLRRVRLFLNRTRKKAPPVIGAGRRWRLKNKRMEPVVRALPGYLVLLFCPVALGVYLPAGGRWLICLARHQRSLS
jgi:hypothetical protein